MSHYSEKELENELRHLEDINRKIKEIINLVPDVSTIQSRLYITGDLDDEDVVYISNLHDMLFRKI